MNSEAEGTPLQVIHCRKTVVEYWKNEKGPLPLELQQIKAEKEALEAEKKESEKKEKEAHEKEKEKEAAALAARQQRQAEHQEPRFHKFYVIPSGVVNYAS